VGKQRGDTDDRFELDPLALTRHAIILGATGSGKTVLSKVLVEEAALQGIPAFAIDPKGDIGNLAFQSPDFNFSKWSSKEADALGQDRAAYASGLQKFYQGKVQEFGVDLEAAARFAKVPVRIFTPKSSAGLPVGISPDLSAPEGFAALLQKDPSSAADMLDLTSFALLRLAGYGEGDRHEVTFVSALLEDAWKAGRSLSIKDLIRAIENPPISTVGSLHVSDVLADRDRRRLATRINLLVSDPRLRSWSAAPPLDFDSIFKNGQSVSVLDLRNIQSEQEKHLFVELVLQQLFQWLVKQGSAQTLRYLLYFDEIAGYCPPVREPPSKKLLLLLIKQARAFGLGLLLASQNAVDLDYKVISNANVRFIGRLGAQRDIQRVSVGLELGSHAEKEIARLKAGEFFCNIFDPKFKDIVRSRWTLTYHRGPLEDGEITELMAPFKQEPRLSVAEPSNEGEEKNGWQEPRSTAAATAEAIEGKLEKDEDDYPQAAEPAPVDDDGQEYGSAAVAATDRHETFIMLEKRFESKNLAGFIRLGSNVKSLEVLSVEREERLHPFFELRASVSEKTYARQSLEKVQELAAFGGELAPLPQPAQVTAQRPVSASARREAAERWAGELERRAGEMKRELQAKFDVVMEEARKSRIAAKSEKPLAKIASIKATMARLQESLNAEIDAVRDAEKLLKQLKKEKKKNKSRIISVENRIEARKQKVISTRRRIEQLHADREAIEEKLREMERQEDDKFHGALSSGVRAGSSYSVAGWLVETVYRARIAVNGGSREHYGDVQWSAYTGVGTWGRCSSCSVALEEGSSCSCGNLLCNQHLAYCKSCLEPACMEHRALCYICHSVFCAKHSAKCELCGRVACASHGGTCAACSRKVCSNCSQKKGLIKRELVCKSCSSSLQQQ
jgi:hypothetical protein